MVLLVARQERTAAEHAAAVDRVAERVSRYARSPVTVSPEAADIRVSAVLKVGDVDGFVEAMTKYLPVVAQPQGSGMVLRRKPGQEPDLQEKVLVA